MIYDNTKPSPAAAPVELPEPWDAERLARNGGEQERDMGYYQPDQGLQDAVNTALLLRRPLLLTGEPGTGKTELAAHLAWKLNWGKALRFDTKSTSVARDLFYSYDALGHFRAVQMQAALHPQIHTQTAPAQARDYMTLSPLGLAILWSLDEAELQRRALYELLQQSLSEHGLSYHGPRCSVVLIDEIDKAPRDFPNDILNELEDLSFRIPELGTAQDATPIRAASKLRPVVIITSNSEKHLPDPFLRRCVYYNIPFPLEKPDAKQPQRQLMRNLINAQSGIALNGVLKNQAFLEDALSLFYVLRCEQIRKQPSTAELLAWLYCLRHEFHAELTQEKPFSQVMYPLAAVFKNHSTRITKDLGILLKVKEDIEEEMPRLLESWAQARLAQGKT